MFRAISRLQVGGKFFGCIVGKSFQLTCDPESIALAGTQAEALK